LKFIITHRAVISKRIKAGPPPDTDHLTFDNLAHLNHMAIAAVPGVILKLPPLKYTPTRKQAKSRNLAWERSLTRRPEGKPLVDLELFRSP